MNQRLPHQQVRPPASAGSGAENAGHDAPYLPLPRRDLLELVVSGAPIGEALNAVVRSVAQVRRQETRAAIFIFDPDGAKLRFAAAEGLSEDYTSKIDHFPVGPGQPSCGKAAYLGNDVIVGDVANDAAWAPYIGLAEQHGIGACWSFLLKGPQGRVLGTFALYHRTPCVPDPSDYEEVRYFVNIASLMVERHVETDARRREQEAREEELHAASRQKDAFLATLAHELRNPLGAIGNCLSLLRRADDQPAVRERALDWAGRQQAQMERLIEDLLDTNRLTRGELTLRLAHVVLTTAVDLAVETARPLFESKAQPFVVTLPGHSVVLQADPVRVTQMITNLLSNASKFTAAGGRIFLDVALQDGDVLIRVRDEGIGIATDHIGAVFAMFSQVGAVRDGANNGLGIGLHLVRGLAHMHGGSIDAHSEGEGKGAEFVLRLPVDRKRG